MKEKKHKKECKCAFCGNNDFEVPIEILEAIKKKISKSKMNKNVTIKCY